MLYPDKIRSVIKLFEKNQPKINDPLLLFPTKCFNDSDKINLSGFSMNTQVRVVRLR